VNHQRTLPQTYRIVSIKRETANVTTLTFPVSLGAKPGQFVMLWVPGVDEIPMSVANDDGKELRVTFFAVGEATRALAEKKEGELIGLRGPFGTSYAWEKGQHLALVAGGYGAAPMYFAAAEATRNGCTADVIVGARGKEHLLYKEEFRKLTRTTLHLATDDGSEGHKGNTVEVLRELFEKGASFDGVFACGPEKMLVAVADVAAEKKVPCQLSMERYMKCGYGLCGNCTVDPLGLRMCVEGPVVRGDVARTIMEFGQYHRDDLGKKNPL
jgi:dihydroorotate dehydrogenase electron transfer subunit